MAKRDQLRVMFWMSDGDDIPGGHRTQMVKTAAAIAELGHDIVLANDPNADCAGFDVVHAFWPTPEQVRSARNAGCKVAISTVYNPIRFTHGLDRRGPWRELIRTRARRAASSAIHTLSGKQIEHSLRILERVNQTRLAYESADLLLPNSRAELADIRIDLGVTTRAAVVPNAIDGDLFLNTRPTSAAEREGVICVGRIEPHKNQLTLARACSQLGVSLTLVGAKHPHHPDYLSLCLAANRRIKWIDEVDQATLVALYDRARVHALCSWFETTGLSSLEAAARRCSITTTERGYAREYFEGDATYCNPDSLTSVTAAIGKALQTESSERLVSRITQRFTWRETARLTQHAYESLFAPSSEVDGHQSGI